MKRNNQNEAVAQAPKLTLAIDAETLNEMHGLLDQRKKLDDVMNSAPAEIAAAEAELANLRCQLGALEADVVLIDDAKLPALQKEIAKLADTIDTKDLTLRRLKARVEALEARAPELDSKIEIAIGYVRVEANMAAQDIQVALAEELRNKVAEVRYIYAKLRALQGFVPHTRTSDFLISAYVPDLESCMRINTSTGHYDAAPNLLASADADTAEAEAEVAEALKPITAALLVARKHKPYVPLAKRPQLYVNRGTLVDLSDSSAAAVLAQQGSVLGTPEVK
ncbi:hypothetical protein LJ656_27400 [Paraburkholderia sp. MMS20-SJTR3]|uniref:Uncharacterized protein n=1 Tax=Paraburkholderia sejongensis TaxID=2886946 RepID=A0ABS8K2E3_9BURK|nr:hypothetical protein [Paraburkholderia sp. MMS20-SJTR3]MCC8396321.1 hypothetical protein [Paraburkholderia sp. MMS20-SJTR3]